MNAFSRFVEQADVNLADLSRRTIDSVTVPLKVKSQEVIADITETVTASAKAIAIKAALGLFAAVMAIIALAYGLSALHSYLARVTGPIEATLIMAGVFAVLAVAALLAVVFWPKPAQKAASAAKVRKEANEALFKARREAKAAYRNAEKSARLSDAPIDTPRDMAASLGAVATALGEAGFRREQAGLRAGLALAEQLRPVQLVALALIGGFIAGMRLKRRG